MRKAHYLFSIKFACYGSTNSDYIDLINHLMSDLEAIEDDELRQNDIDPISPNVHFVKIPIYNDKTSELESFQLIFEEHENGLEFFIPYLLAAAGIVIGEAKSRLISKGFDKIYRFMRKTWNTKFRREPLIFVIIDTVSKGKGMIQIEEFKAEYIECLIKNFHVINDLLNDYWNSQCFEGKLVSEW
ncbi:MAG: hypothetical protein ACFFAE_22680 [Candidatus Hodarchaeota archaeon]